MPSGIFNMDNGKVGRDAVMVATGVASFVRDDNNRIIAIKKIPNARLLTAFDVFERRWRDSADFRSKWSNKSKNIGVHMNGDTLLKYNIVKFDGGFVGAALTFIWGSENINRAFWSRFLPMYLSIRRAYRRVD